MKKIHLYYFFLFFITLSEVVLAQNTVPFYDKSSGKWGLKDNRKEQVILSAKFDKVTPIKGLIYQSSFNEDPSSNHRGYPDVFFAVKDGQTSVVDNEGKVIACCFTELWKKEGSFGSYIYGTRTGMENTLFVMINPEYRSLSEVPYLELTDLNFKLLYEEGGDLDLVRYLDKNTGLVGLRKNGSEKVILPAKYDDIDYASYSLFSDPKNCCWFRSRNEGNKFGLINPKGEEILPPIYDQLNYHFIWSGYGLIEKDGKAGLINNKGVVVKELSEDTILPVYATFEKRNTRLFLLYGNAGQWQLVDEDLRPVFNERFDTLFYERFLDDGFWYFSRNGNWGLAKWNGKIILPLSYSEIVPLDENTFRVKKNGKFGYVDNHNRVLIPTEYDILSHQYDYNFSPCRVSNSLAKKGNDYYLLDREGKVQKKPEYDRIIPRTWWGNFNFQYNYYLVKDDDFFGVIDLDGNEKVSPVYDSLKAINYHSHLVKIPYVYAISNGKYGVVKLNNELIVPIRYDRISNFRYLPFVEYHQVWLNDTTGLYDQDGNIIIPLEYRKIEKARGNCIIVERDNKFGLYLFDGTMLAEPKYEQHTFVRIDDPGVERGYHFEAIELRIGEKKEVFNCR